MKFLFFLAAYPLVFAGLKRSAKRTVTRKLRTTGNDHTALLEYKFVAAIYSSNNLISAGTLYRNDIVITGATHVQKSKKLFDVKTFPTFENGNLVESVHKVVGIKYHHQYRFDKSPKFNIAVMKLDRPSGKTSNLILDKEGLAFDESRVRLFGWGYEEDTFGNIQTFKSLTIPIIEKDKCQSLHQYPILFSQEFCAGSLEDNYEAYFISQGSPLIKEVNGVPVLIGIASWTENYATTYQPNVFVRVSSFADWIERAIGN